MNRCLQLDDWVLCRVRQKGGTARNAYEDLDRNNSKDIIWHLPVIEEACRPYDNYENDMINECLKKDCGVLASILAGKTLPIIQSISSVGNQGSSVDNGFTSAYEDGRCFNTYGSLKRKPNEEVECDNFVPSNKKISTDNGNEEIQPREKQSQSGESFYNPNMFDLFDGFPTEYDELATYV